MKRFVELFRQVDATTSTNDKVAALVAYYRDAPSADAAWATYFLTGQRLKRFITSRDLQAWVQARTGMSDWLFREAYHAVGDTAETVALLAAGSTSQMPDLPLSAWLTERILPLKKLPEEQQAQQVQAWWAACDIPECFVLNKILTGAFRIGVAKTLVFKALAQVSELDVAVISQRFFGAWEPSAEFFEAALSDAPRQADVATPYPFYLAYPLEQAAETLGAPEGWWAEWKWDGIRGQLMKQPGGTLLWSRGEELIGEQFPELLALAEQLPDGTAIDGEILCWQGGAPMDFARLQKRLGRKKPSANVLKQNPAVLMAYDLLEWQGADIRGLPLTERKARLTALVQQIERHASDANRLLLSPEVVFEDWGSLEALRQSSREFGVEGLMLKARQSPYRAGRKKGAWWKFKIEPFTVDAVLLYAQPGSGRRANLYTDYTFAVWQGDALVPVAKAYSGLTDAEINQVDNWIRKHTLERFGPVRSVAPELVFELAFENIAASPRHKSGIALRFPRIKRWRRDKPAREADSIALLTELLANRAAASPLVQAEANAKKITGAETNLATGRARRALHRED